MKQIRNAFTLAAAIALAAFASVGCATTSQSTENLAVAAGFRVVTPTNANQEALLKGMPPGKVSPLNYQGKRYYVLPEAANNQAYVGGPKQYQSYQQLRLDRQMSNQNLEAAEMNEMSSEWNSWGGWGPGYW